MNFKNSKELFLCNDYIDLVKKNLPHLFEFAEIECSRGGKIGMQVGTVREDIIYALTRSFVGSDNVNDAGSIKETSKDIILLGNEVSIKTFTGTYSGNVKVFWTSDTKLAEEFCKNYKPKYDMIIASIMWGSNKGGLYYIDLETQQEIIEEIGLENYIKTEPGTNNRGIKIRKNAMNLLLNHKNTIKIQIDWVKNNLNYDRLERFEKMIIK
jgi:hypothetical protein